MSANHTRSDSCGNRLLLYKNGNAIPGVYLTPVNRRAGQSDIDSGNFDVLAIERFVVCVGLVFVAGNLLCIEDYVVSIRGRREEGVNRTFPKRYVPGPGNGISTDVGREIGVGPSILDRVIVRILIVAVRSVDPADPHEVLLLVERGLINQLEAGERNLVRMKVSV